MTIESEIRDELTRAMRAKDAPRVACLRQVIAKVQEAVTAKGFSGEVDDDLYRKVIRGYVRSLEKAIAELATAGDRAEELRATYEQEVTLLGPYMPQTLDEAATRALVLETIERLGARDPKRAGQVIGAIVKEKRDEVDASLVRRLVEEALRPEEP